jgi:hypothetical protein
VRFTSSTTRPETGSARPPHRRRRLAAAAAVLATAMSVVALAPAGQAATDRAGGVPSLRLDAAGPNALRLSWAPAPGAAHYRISWYDQDGPASWTSEPDYSAGSSPVTLTGLTAGHLYAVEVTAYDAEGREGVGWYPVSVSRATVGDRVSGGVSSITLSDVGPTSLRVNWSAAPGATRYRIAWDDQTSYAYQSWTSGPDYRGGPVALTGLLPGHDYKVTVTPVDGAGSAGSASAIRRAPVDTSVTPPGSFRVTVAPGAPGTLRVSWTPSAGATRYRIHWRNVAGDSWTGSAPDYTAGNSPVTLTGLAGGLPTTVTVTPYNDGGSGPDVSVSGTPTT